MRKDSYEAPKLPVGVYRLDKPVSNPGGDKRKTRDWRERPEFETGRYLIVECYVTRHGCPSAHRIKRPERYDYIFLRNVYDRHKLNQMKVIKAAEGGSGAFMDLTRTEKALAVRDDIVEVDSPSVAVLLRSLVPDTSFEGLFEYASEMGISREEILLEIINSGGALGADIVRGATRRLFAARNERVGQLMDARDEVLHPFREEAKEG